MRDRYKADEQQNADRKCSRV